MSAQGKMTKLRPSLLGAILCLGALLAIPSLASAAAPKWSLTLSAFPSSFASGASGDATEGPAYRLVAENTGDAPTAGSYSLKDTLPSDLTPGAEISGKDSKGNPLSCEVKGQEVTCTGSEAVQPKVGRQSIHEE